MEPVKEKRSKWDAPTYDECVECEGKGYTADTAPEFRFIRLDKKSRMVTIKQGSGCPVCYGTGKWLP